MQSALSMNDPWQRFYQPATKQSAGPTWPWHFWVRPISLGQLTCVPCARELFFLGHSPGQKGGWRILGAAANLDGSDAGWAWVARARKQDNMADVEIGYSSGTSATIEGDRLI